MANVLAYLALLVAFVVVLDAVSRLVVWVTTGRAPRLIEWLVSRWPHQGRSAPQTHAAEEGVELVIAQLELRRLAEEVRRAHASDQPYRVHRLKAVTGAYDDVLLQCCRLAKIEIPGQHDQRSVVLTSRERFEVETALMARGVDW